MSYTLLETLRIILANKPVICWSFKCLNNAETLLRANQKKLTYPRLFESLKKLVELINGIGKFFLFGGVADSTEKKKRTGIAFPMRLS